MGELRLKASGVRRAEVGSEWPTKNSDTQLVSWCLPGRYDECLGVHNGLAAATELTFGASEIGQWISMFAVMPEDMGSVPGTHMVEG